MEQDTWTAHQECLHKATVPNMALGAEWHWPGAWAAVLEEEADWVADDSDVVAMVHCAWAAACGEAAIIRTAARFHTRIPTHTLDGDKAEAQKASAEAQSTTLTHITRLAVHAIS